MYPLDPHGVKKWGGYDPPSSYGCAAHGCANFRIFTFTHLDKQVGHVFVTDLDF